MATNFDRVVTYLERLPPIKSHDPLITWSCEMRWQIKNTSTFTMVISTNFGRMVTHKEELPILNSHDSSCIIFTSTRLTKQVKMVTYRKGLSPIKSHNSLNRFLREVSHIKYRYHNAYGHQTCQGGDILLGTPTHDVTWTFNYAVFRGHVTN